MSKNRPALYVRNYCGFCYRVMRVVGQLKVDVDVRNIWADSAHREALQSATGRGTVPVLRYTNDEGDEVWLPESRDIIAFLNQEYGST